MKIPSYLIDSRVAESKVDYKWTVSIQNRLLASDGDTKPTLGKAIGKISSRAAFSLSVASCEWIATRLSKLVDTSDAFMRIEAGWAATIDPKYAELPDPPNDTGDEVDPVRDPLYLAMSLLSDAHRRYLKSKEAAIFGDCIVLVLLAEHVAGRNPIFKVWLPAVLKVLAKSYPSTSKPPSDQPVVSREIFESVNSQSGQKVSGSQAEFLKGTKPRGNPYLRHPSSTG